MEENTSGSGSSSCAGVKQSNNTITTFAMEENMSGSSSCAGVTQSIEEISVNNGSEEKIDWMSLKFSTVGDAYTFYCHYAHCRGFSVRKMYEKKMKSDPNRVQYIEYCCNKEGFRVGSNLNPNENRIFKYPSSLRKGKHVRNSDETRTGCGAKIRIHFKKYEEVYKVSYFCGDHNHVLHPPSAKHMLKSNRKVNPHKILAEIYGDTGLPLRSSYDLMKLEAGGEEHKGFSKQDLKNQLKRIRQKYLKSGETTTLMRYFSNQSLNNPFFFYEYDLDSNEKITNVFWSDAQMRMDYSVFGDCVTFDTTYRTNKNYWPLVVFVGFNHHRQSCVLGAALLLDDTQESFEWLFNTFVTCMQGKAPKIIFTDQDAAMAPAIRNSLPNTYHALCTWHILENAKINLSELYTDKFVKMFHRLVYDVRDEVDFNKEWEDMVSSCFPAGEHKWITDIHGLRKQWSSAWMRCQFTAGMRTTQMNESSNSIVKRYLQPMDNLIQFFVHFEKTVQRRRVEEEQDSNARDKQIMAKYIFNRLLKDAAEVYTPNIFALFNKEYETSFAYVVKPMDGFDVGNARQYVVSKPEDEFPSVNDQVVEVDAQNASISCSCRLFDNSGILCCHALRLMVILDGMGASNFRTVPGKYILKRWSRNAKSGLNIYHVDSKQLTQLEGALERYQSLCGMFVSSAMVLCRDKDACATFTDQFQKLLNSFVQEDGVSTTLQDEHEDIDTPSNLAIKAISNPNKRNKGSVSISKTARGKKNRKLQKGGLE